MKATFIDCPPFLHELYRGELTTLVPDLEINLGSPSADEVKTLLADATLAMNDHTQLDEALLAACPRLRAIVFLGTGAASYIDLAAAERLGIRVRAYGGYGDQSVAEHAIALMFAAARRLAAVELDELQRTADVVSLHLVLNDQTTGFLDARRIGLLKPGAILINTARGAIVDEAALLAALEAGRIGHAGLDVFASEPLGADHPLAALPNVTLTAHAAFATREASERLLRMALELLAEERRRLT
jgi:phosphoglycerate dehydrogenase-like enzyme